MSSPRPYFGTANSQIVIRDDVGEGETPRNQLLRSLNAKGIKFLTLREQRGKTWVLILFLFSQIINYRCRYFFFKQSDVLSSKFNKV